MKSAQRKSSAARSRKRSENAPVRKRSALSSSEAWNVGSDAGKGRKERSESSSESDIDTEDKREQFRAAVAAAVSGNSKEAAGGFRSDNRRKQSEVSVHDGDDTQETSSLWAFTNAVNTNAPNSDKESEDDEARQQVCRKKKTVEENPER